MANSASINSGLFKHKKDQFYEILKELLTKAFSIIIEMRENVVESILYRDHCQ